MNTKRFKIGDAVLVTATTDSVRDFGTDRRELVRKHLDAPRVGQVVGVSRRSSGHVKYDHDGNLFVSDVTVIVWLVRFGMMNKAVPVADEDLVEADPFDVPSMANPCTWTEEASADMRRELLARGRDAKGRLLAGDIVVCVVCKKMFRSEDTWITPCGRVCGDCEAPVFDAPKARW